MQANIQNAKYIADENGNNVSVNAEINGEFWSIPMDSSNRHYQMLLKWLSEGNTPEPADEQGTK